MRLNLLRLTSLLLVALLAGLGFAHLLEAPAKMAYPAPLYFELQKSLYVHWGPPNIGGFLEPIAIAATAALAFFLWNSRITGSASSVPRLLADRHADPYSLLRHQKVQFRFTLAAVLALLLAFPVVFFWLVAPANAGFRTASVTAIPHDWAALRRNWELGHAIRFGLQFGALVSLVLSLLVGSRTGASRQVRPKSFAVIDGGTVLVERETL